MERKRPELGTREVRSWAVDDVELREDAGAFKLTGYATVFERSYEMYGGPPMGWTEIVDRGALDKTLSENPDVQLLVNHEGLPLARTKSGTLSLEANRKGLKVSAELDAGDPDVARLRPKMDRGDLDEMSFAFRTIRQEWNEDYTERRLTELSLQKGDVSVVNYGANPNTSVTLRAYEALEHLATFTPDELLAEVRAGASPLTPAYLAEARDYLAAILEELTPQPERVGMNLATARALATALDL